METELKRIGRLARVCRKHGIEYFKNAEFEFSLLPPAPRQKKTKPAPTLVEVKIPEHVLSDDELLFGESL